MTDISNMRTEFDRNNSLSIEKAPQDPFVFFEEWFSQARNEPKIAEPNGFVLSTSNQSNQINSRTVLLKYFDRKGFVFFTNYNSKKAKDINQNTNVSVCFPWYALERQIIINGIAEKTTTSESLKYFMSRPRGSQIGAWVSQQSQVISSKKILLSKLSELKNTLSNKSIPYPNHWGGYRITPLSIEFWQGQPNRLHDRLYYSRPQSNDITWKIDRLSP